MSDSDEDELFEAFINRPHGCFSESICGDDFEKQKLSRRDELESALKNCLDDKGRDVLSGYTEVVEEYWSTVGRGYFRLAVRLGRVLERQREAEQLLANRGRKTP